MKRYVLDAPCILAFLEDGPGAGTVENLLGRALEKQEQILIAATSWGELYQSIMLKHGEHVARDRIAQLAKLPWEIVAIDPDTAELAAVLSCRSRIEIFRCLPLAVAQIRNAELVSFDSNAHSEFLELRPQIRRGRVVNE